jgi:hypothetical protein
LVEILALLTRAVAVEDLLLYKLALLILEWVEQVDLAL